MVSGVKNEELAKVSQNSDKQKMPEQMMSKEITNTVAEAKRVVVQMMVEAQVQRTPNAAGSKPGSPTLKQPSFHWETTDKYTELKTFNPEVRNILAMYNTPEVDKVAIVKSWLRKKGIHYLEILMPTEKEAYNMLEGLFDTLATKFKSQYTKTINQCSLENCIG